MLFVNLDLILELISANLLRDGSECRLKYYNLICDSTLEEDIKLTEREKEYINNLVSSEGNYNIYFEREKEIFTKLLVSDYLRKNGYSNIDGDIDSVELFDKYASSKLKNDKDFANVIIGLDGSYISIMGEKIRNNRDMMTKAISSDSSSDVSSFVNTNSRLKSDSVTAILYFRKLKDKKQDKFSPEDIYDKVFKKIDGKFVDYYFKENEQSSWLDDPNFLKELIKIDSDFVDYIVDFRISKLNMSKSSPKLKVKE